MSKHPDDETLLAYLDGEASNAQMRTVHNHLKSCWKCRSMLADLETQAEAISRLLSVQLDSDIDRSVRAKEKFLRWRALLEEQRKLFFRRGRLTLLLASVARVALVQS